MGEVFSIELGNNYENIVASPADAVDLFEEIWSYVQKISLKNLWIPENKYQRDLWTSMDKYALNGKWGEQLGAPYAATAHSFLFRVTDPGFRHHCPPLPPAITRTGSRPLLINPRARCPLALPFPFVIVPWRLFSKIHVHHFPLLQLIPHVPNIYLDNEIILCI